MAFLEFLTCTLLIFLSGCFSASEIALFSLSRFQLRFLKENFRPVYRKIKKLLSDPGGLLITLLVLNEFINVAISTIIAQAISRHHFEIPPGLGKLPRWSFETLLGILITAPIVLFLCEITPKVVGARINKLVATLAATPLNFLYSLFKPVRYILTHAIRILLKSPFFKAGKRGPLPSHANEAILKESDFLLMLEEGRKEGAIQENELKLIRNVFALDNSSVAEVSTPLSQVLSVNVHTTVKEALSVVRTHRYSRIPVIGSNRKEVVGVLYSKDLLRSKLQPELLQTTIAALMRKPYFVNSNLKLNILFRKFKQHRIHMAIVRNATGEITGVVTMSDVLDALFDDFLADEDYPEKLHSATTMSKS